ncbi:MAG: M48 family metalloprotease [Candidatus Bathyarchaeia archaeon]|jgi:heat shock protein HtpX
MAHRTFWDEQRRNRRDSLLLAILVSLFLFGIIYIFALMFAPDALIFVLPFSVIIIVIYTWSSYQYGDKVVLASTHARPAEGPEFTYLNNIAEGLAIAAGVPPPKVYVIDNPDINAFSTGKDPQHASIAVNTGAINQLNREELEGVVAHEMSHVRNRDVEFMTYIAVLVGLVSILSHVILQWAWFAGVTGASQSRGRGRSRDGGGGLQIVILVVGLLLAILAPIATTLIELAVSRRREFLADAGGAELTRNPEGLASALEKIKNLNQGRMKVDQAVSPLFISDPNKRGLDLFATHPPIDERIKRLREM